MAAVSPLATTDGPPKNTMAMLSKKEECGARATMDASDDGAAWPTTFSRKPPTWNIHRITRDATTLKELLKKGNRRIRGEETRAVSSDDETRRARKLKRYNAFFNYKSDSIAYNKKTTVKYKILEYVQFVSLLMYQSAYFSKITESIDSIRKRN